MVWKRTAWARCWATIFESTGMGGAAACSDGAAIINVRATMIARTTRNNAAIPLNMRFMSSPPAFGIRRLDFHCLQRVYKESPRFSDGFRKAAPYHRRLGRQCGQEAAGAGGVQDDEHALVGFAANKAAKCLFQPKPSQQIVIGLTEPRAPRFVQNGGFGPRHLVENTKPERTPRDVDPIAQGIRAEKAGVLFGTE